MFLQKSTYENTEQKEGCSSEFILLVNEIKALVKYFLLYLVVGILQLVHEKISSFPEVPCKRSDLENLPKFTDEVIRICSAERFS